MSTLFTKIINREVPGDIVYEDEHVVAFRDIFPEAPVHIVLAIRTEVPSLAETADTGDHVHLLNAARNVAAKLGLTDGYRVVINTGPDGGQSIDHLHAHLLGGRAMGWPPG